jgi:hypothetical protein
MFKQSRVSYDLKAGWGNHGKGGMQKWLMEHFLGMLAWRPIDIFEVLEEMRDTLGDMSLVLVYWFGT